MSFLTPLYILGLTAISLPILFHLIRRTPKGVQPFSSLMFVTPTPPRLTRRSRIDQLLLLLLRAAVVGLLAFAFARPFLRQATTTDLSDVSQRLFAVLIDTSGSMRRQGIWQQVEAELERILDEMGPNDAISLYHFGARPERVTSFDEAASLALGGRRILIRKRFQELRPGWGESSLGDALILAADELDAVEDSSTKGTLRQLVVISDMQQGSHIESLQAYQWPQSVNVVYRQVAAQIPGNASLHVLGSLTDSGDEQDVRVRVANSLDAQQGQFEISWADTEHNQLGKRLGISVPPGESRVIRIPRLSPGIAPTHLQLTGDAHEFDNRFYVAAETPTEGVIVYLGKAADDDPDQMLYYLKRAVTNDRWRPVRIVTENQAAIAALESKRPLLAVITTRLEPTFEVPLRTYLRKGGTGLVVLSTPDDVRAANELAATDLGSAEEVTPDDYALWSEIDFDHRMFRPFANPQYNDFSKIHFWNYRRLKVSDEGGWNAIVRYDNGDPALLESKVGEGQLVVLTASWRPEASQLARSTKFVPLLLSMIGTESPLQSLGYEIDESIACPRPMDQKNVKITKPDDTVVPLASSQTEFSAADQPGLYRLQLGDREQTVAVNLARSETRTAPLDLAQLEERGVRTGDGSTFAEELEALRQMRDIDLEAKQSVWQWLIAAALLLLIVETVLASRWSMQTAPSEDPVASSEAS